jgi:hypothetical protein
VQASGPDLLAFGRRQPGFALVSGSPGTVVGLCWAPTLKPARSLLVLTGLRPRPCPAVGPICAIGLGPDLVQELSPKTLGPRPNLSLPPILPLPPPPPRISLGLHVLLPFTWLPFPGQPILKTSGLLSHSASPRPSSSLKRHLPSTPFICPRPHLHTAPGFPWGLPFLHPPPRVAPFRKLLPDLLRACQTLSSLLQRMQSGTLPR